MLKSFFGIFEVTESQLRPEAIKRLKLASWVSLMFAPMLALFSFGGFETGSAMKNLTAIMIVICFIGFTVMGFPRIFNRIWTPDRYLDESEIARKREVNSFAFMWFIGGMIVFLLLFIGLELAFGSIPEIEFGSTTVLGVLFGILITAMSLQGIKLAQLLQPLDNDDSPAEKTKVDRYYAVGVAAYMAFFILLGHFFGS